MKAGDVFVGVVQFQLLQNVMAHAAGGACGECGDRPFREVSPQGTELPVFGAEFVSPFRDTMRLIDGKKSKRHLLKPRDGLRSREAFG